MPETQYVTVVADVKRESDAALLLDIDGEEHWVPKSQIRKPGDYREGDEDATISITKWIADKRGIDGDPE